MKRICRIGRERPEGFLTGAIKFRVLVATNVRTNPVIFLARNLGCGKPTALWLQAINPYCIFSQIKVTAKKRTIRTLCVKVHCGIIDRIQSDATFSQRLGEDLDHLMALSSR